MRNESPSSLSRRIPASLLIRLCVGVLLLVAIFSTRAKLGETLEVLRGAGKGWLLIALALAVLGEFLTSQKWNWLLSGAGYRIGTWPAFRASLVGMFYNNFLPGSVGGDVVKTMMVARDAGGLAIAAASTFVQRNTGLAALLIIANIAVWLKPVTLALFPPRMELFNSLRFWFGALAVGYVMANVVIFAPGVAAQWKRASGFLAARRAGRLLGVVAQKAGRLHESLLLFRSGLPLAVAVSLFTQMTDCAMVYVLSRAVHLDLSFAYFCYFAPAVAVAALVPVSVNGIGLREAVYILLLQSVHVTPEKAVGISVLQFGYILLLSASGGLLHLLHRGEETGATGLRPR